MTATVRQLLASFDKLPEAEQQEATVEILRRSLGRRLPPLDDQVLVERAEELFCEMDKQEEASERS